MLTGEVWLSLEAQSSSAAASCITGARGGGSDGPISEDHALELCCGIFHGFSSDGSQLMHIINLLGGPSITDMDAMKIEGACRIDLEALVRALPENASSGQLSSSSKTLGLCQFLARRYVPLDVAHLIASMLSWNPADRLTAASSMWHPALMLPSQGGFGQGSDDYASHVSLTPIVVSSDPMSGSSCYSAQ